MTILIKQGLSVKGKGIKENGLDKLINNTKRFLLIWNSIGVAYRLHWKLISNVDNITKGNDIHIGFYDLCLEVKELNLKDGYENIEEISKLKSTLGPSNK